MADPHAILLVPTEGGAALLALGRLGQRPPCLVSYPKRGPDTQPPWLPYAIPTMDMGYGRVLALPLVWDGMPVPDGVFRAWNAWGPDEDEVEFEATGWTTYDVLAEALDGAGAAEWLARSLERMGLCRVVLLDLVDGALVERAP